MRTIKLMADYHCWPLWGVAADDLGDIDPADLPLSEDLRLRLRRWAAAYDATLVEDDPVRSGFASDAAAAAFEAEGRALGEALATELGDGYRVIVQIP